MVSQLSFDKHKDASVAILLGTYNGDNFLAEQLDSLEAQTLSNWRVYASDDGSVDNTMEILRAYQMKWGSERIQIRVGPKNGFAQNFLSLACDPSIKAEYYAFCDQDDVWLPEKLSVAVERIASESTPEQLYAYGGRTTYTNEKLKPIGLSPLFVFPRTFRNALIQSIAGGNTMVFNQATKTLFEKVGVVPAASHDWWLYQLVTGAGGVMHYDPEPYVYYRQHKNSLSGENVSLRSQLVRFYILIGGKVKEWIDQNIYSLHKAQHYLRQENIELLNLFVAMRKAKLKNRLRLVQVCGLYRQTRRGTLTLAIASLLGKI